VRGEVDDGLDLVFGEQTFDQRTIADLADHQRHVAHCLAESRWIDRRAPRRARRARPAADRVAADVAGAASDQDRWIRRHVEVIPPNEWR
jgi:hypothetical protein